MSEIKATEITQKQLIRGMKASKDPNSSIRYGFILGAGASVKSDIKSGSELAYKWYQEIKEDICDEELKKWQNDIVDFDEKKLAEFYTKIFEKRFEGNYEEGYQELQGYMDSARPSVGYSFLAQMLDETQNKFVITTNFDTMTEDALFEFKKSKPLVLGHELLSKYINPTNPSRPTIIKIHRDFLLNPYNTDDEIEHLDEQWQSALKPVLKNNAMIVIGYGGNDNSLMNYLKGINVEDRKPIYWCYRGDKDKLANTIIKLLTEKDFIVKINGFDEFMLVLNNALEFNSLIDQNEIEKSPIVLNAIDYAKKYEHQLQELAKTELTDTEQDAIKELLPSWWDYQLKINSVENKEDQNRLYKEGLNNYPHSCELMNNYAIFLNNVYLDNDEAEKYYLKTLRYEPENAIYNANYAIFLNNCKKFEEAEKYYIKAIETDPNNAAYNSNYGIFLNNAYEEFEKSEKYHSKALNLEPSNATYNANYAYVLKSLEKNHDKAEKYYLKALQLKPDDPMYNGNYANFLADIKKDFDKAEKFYLKVFELNPNDAINNGNYAVFLNDIRKDFDEAEKYYLKALELEPQKASFNANYAVFLNDTRKKSDEAEKYYLKALELEPNNSIYNANYAIFLNNIKSDYKEAEKFYKMSIELDPKNAINNNNYANFLNEIIKDYDKAEEYYLIALKLDPQNNTTNSSYAIFLNSVRKELNKSEKYYIKALKIEPTNANSNGNYAQLLLQLNKKEAALKYIEKAHDYFINEYDLLIELWFYKLAHFTEYYKESQEKIDELLNKGYHSIGWDFSGNIERAKEDGFKDIELLEEYAKKITLKGYYKKP